MASANTGVPEFTSVVAVDSDHLEELRIAWPTWRAFRPEIVASPIHFYCDLEAGDTRHWAKQLAFVDHPSRRVYGWYQDGAETQREKMLSSLVYGPPKTVETPWFLKIDTDTIAYPCADWLLSWWFDENPAFVSSPWGYTVPADALQRLDDWADGVDGLKEFPRLNIPFNPLWRMVRHSRVISWLYFGRTDWHREIVKLLGPRLPVPSQDTVCHYIAERRRNFYRRVKFSRHGWRHVSGLGRMRAAAAEALAGTSQGREVVA